MHSLTHFQHRPVTEPQPPQAAQQPGRRRSGRGEAERMAAPPDSPRGVFPCPVPQTVPACSEPRVETAGPRNREQM